MFNLLSLLILPLIGAINSQSFPEVLSPEEEAKYLALWEKRDLKARDVLIEHNLRLVAQGSLKSLKTPGKTATICFPSGLSV